jgi:plastocyanin
MLKITLILSFLLTCLHIVPNSSEAATIPCTMEDGNMPVTISCAPPARNHQPALIIVKMVGMRFEPRIQEVNAGDTVRWVNESKDTHNAASNDGLFVSEMLKKGGTFQFVFSNPGTYKYHCIPHKWMGMKGQIVVR